MHVNKTHIFFICLFIVNSLNGQKLLIIDIGFNDNYQYQTFSVLAQSVGFKPTIVSFYEVTPGLIERANCIIMVIDENAAQHFCMHTVNPLTDQLKNIFDLLKQQKNKLLCLWFPSKIGDTTKETIDHSLMITKACCALPHSLQAQLLSFFRFLFQPDFKRSSGYHTSLLAKQETKNKILSIPYKSRLQLRRRSYDIISTTLPLEGFPLGWHSSNPNLCMQFFITKTSLMTFAEINEQFTYTPIDFDMRLTKLNELQQLIYELYNAVLLGKIATDSHLQKPPLPTLFYQQHVINEKKDADHKRTYEVQQSRYGWINTEKIWAGLITLDAYTNKEQEAADTLIGSGLNLLWLELCPELYFSKDGIKKNQQAQFWQQLKNVTDALYESAHQHHQQIPFIYIGFELTGNFNKSVNNPVIDCYGKQYPKIPSPFDFEQTWRKELLDPLDMMVKNWSKYNKMPIAGIFLDFEMYHAKNQASQYNPDMDFSDCAWAVYCRTTKQFAAALLKRHNERINYLMKHKKFKEYFTVLHHEAYAIGKRIKEHINKKLPDAFIAVYNIHPPCSWFYMGIIGGLSSPQEPVILATFNNDFYSHNAWFRAQKIYAYHMPVLLLSKFKEPKDFDLIATTALPFHDGVWFNRISRLQESRNPKDWSWDYGVEVTPLPTLVFTKHLKKKISMIQKQSY